MLKNKKGFTLIEIVIVIVIIAILAAILVPNLTTWIDKAKIATFKAEANTARNVVAAQVVEEKNDGYLIAGSSQDNVSPDFWEKVSAAMDATLQCDDPDDDGYVEFSVDNIGLITFSYSKGKHIAYFDGTNWSYR